MDGRVLWVWVWWFSLLLHLKTLSLTKLPLWMLRRTWVLCRMLVLDRLGGWVNHRRVPSRGRNGQLHDSWRLLLKGKTHLSERLKSCQMGRIWHVHSDFLPNNLTDYSCLLLFSSSHVHVHLRVYSVRQGGCYRQSAHNIICCPRLFGRGLFLIVRWGMICQGRLGLVTLYRRFWVRK